MKAQKSVLQLWKGLHLSLIHSNYLDSNSSSITYYLCKYEKFATLPELQFPNLYIKYIINDLTRWWPYDVCEHWEMQNENKPFNYSNSKIPNLHLWIYCLFIHNMVILMLLFSLFLCEKIKSINQILIPFLYFKTFSPGIESQQN